jgi:hypothetical protein
MALNKSVENNMGVSFEYWRVMPQIGVDFAEGTAHASLRVWATQAARSADKVPANIHEFLTPESEPLIHEALSLSGEDFTTALATGDLRAAFYTRLKALDFFADAEDVLEDPA